jgi:hypothetical protein
MAKLSTVARGGNKKMRITLFAVAVICTAVSLDFEAARAQSWQMNTQSYALKSGESTEIGDLYWVVNCQSQLQGPPEVTILDGPPGVTASITEAMVVPRFQQCPKAVKGAKLKLSAEQIEEQSSSQMTLRIRYKTKDGVRDKSMSFMISLFP